MYTHVCVYIYTHTYIYIYIYIYMLAAHGAQRGGPGSDSRDCGCAVTSNY